MRSRESNQPRLRSLAAEQGFTIVEILITILLISLGLLAAVGALESATRTAYSAERQEQLVGWGQREMERMRTLPYEELGHVTGTLPSHEDDGTEPGDNNPRNPNFFVAETTGNFLVKASYADSASGPGGGTGTAGEPLVAGGSVVSEDNFDVAGTTGTVYRYITQRTETCLNCEADDSRRVTLAIVPDLAGNGSGPRKPIWLTTIVNDPLARPPGTQAPSPSQPAVTAQPFFLHDVSCAVGYGLGTQPAQQPTTHATHNTSQTGTTCTGASAPDSMSNVAPVRDGTAPLQNYSDDPDLTRTSPAGGLVLRRLGSDCPTGYSAAEAPSRKQSIHTWATPTFTPAAFTTPTNDARTAFSFWTQTVDGAAGSATLCLTLRRSGQPAVALASHAYSLDQWPREPTQLSLAFDHPAFTVPAGERLLLTVSVKAESTNNVALMYGHPDYASLLTVSTTTPLE